MQSVTYTPINQSYFGNPALEISDRFTTNGKTALLTGYTWKFGGLQTLESASYTPETLSDTTRTDKIANVAKTTAEKAKTTAEKAETEIAEMKAEIASWLAAGKYMAMRALLASFLLNSKNARMFIVVYGVKEELFCSSR